jgi:hypothetical protein
MQYAINYTMAKIKKTEHKDKLRSTNITHTIRDRETRTPLKS